MNCLLMWFLLVFGQSQAPTTPPPPPPPPLETGSLQNGIYQNNQLGLIYRLPVRATELHSFAPDEKLVKKGKLPVQRFLSLSTYATETGPVSQNDGHGRTRQYGQTYGDSGYTGRVVRIKAYYDQYYANPEDAIAYLQKEAKSAKSAGDKIVRDAEEGLFGGQKFYRSDFLRSSATTTYFSGAPGTYVWFVTTWRGYLLVINYWTDDISGNDKGGMEWLMRSMNTIRLFDPNSPPH